MAYVWLRCSNPNCPASDPGDDYVKKWEARLVRDYHDGGYEDFIHDNDTCCPDCDEVGKRD